MPAVTDSLYAKHRNTTDTIVVILGFGFRPALTACR